MNRIVNQFKISFKLLKEKSWDKIYVAIDIHETCLKPTWSSKSSTEFYKNALETLQMMSNHPQICLIMWSCSTDKVIHEYLKFFAKNGINFHYANENPECPSTEWANFESKLYFNVGLDDKFGFIPRLDWKPLKRYFESL